MNYIWVKTVRFKYQCGESFSLLLIRIDRGPVFGELFAKIGSMHACLEYIVENSLNKFDKYLYSRVNYPFIN